jgi:hypothetical protein
LISYRANKKKAAGKQGEGGAGREGEEVGRREPIYGGENIVRINMNCGERESERDQGNWDKG